MGEAALTAQQVRHGERRRRLLSRIPSALATIVPIGGAILMIAPFWWLFTTAVQPSGKAYDLPPSWIPSSLTLQNFVRAVSGPIPLLKEFMNSVIAAFAVTIGVVSTSALAGFAFAHLRFPGRGLIFAILLTSLMVPVQVTIIPLFLGMSQVGLVNSLPSIILPALTSAFGVFLMREFFMSLPRELIEAAKLDSAGPFTVFRAIALPLARPVLSALAVIAFLGSWNGYFAPLVFLRDVETATLPLGIVFLLGPYRSGDVGMVMAGTTLAVLPALIVFLLAQRWIVDSLARTGVKG